MTIIVLFLKLTFLYKIVVYIECLVGFMSINTIIDEGEIEFLLKLQRWNWDENRNSHSIERVREI